jgi:hypothetical protein
VKLKFFLPIILAASLAGCTAAEIQTLETDAHKAAVTGQTIIVAAQTGESTVAALRPLVSKFSPDLGAKLQSVLDKFDAQQATLADVLVVLNQIEQATRTTSQ